LACGGARAAEGILPAVEASNTVLETEAGVNNMGQAATELDALLLAIFSKAFKGEL
jgi:methyl coenzyme M reductase beta subunit